MEIPRSLKNTKELIVLIFNDQLNHANSCKSYISPHKDPLGPPHSGKNWQKENSPVEKLYSDFSSYWKIMKERIRHCRIAGYIFHNFSFKNDIKIPGHTIL